jgi:hypothetical protein
VLKNYGIAALVLTLPGRAAYALVYLLFAARRGVLGSCLRGWWEALRLAPRALSLRRGLAGRRLVGDGRLLVADDLSISPHIRRSRLEARLEKTFNVSLRAWWRVTRWLLPRGRNPS